MQVVVAVVLSTQVLPVVVVLEAVAVVALQQVLVALQILEVVVVDLQTTHHILVVMVVQEL